MAFRDQFLGSLAGSTSGAASDLDRYDRLLFNLRHRGGYEEVLALGLMALREHLKSRSSPPEEYAPPATGDGISSPGRSGPSGPSDEEVRIVLDHVGLPWHMNNVAMACSMIKALDEHRKRAEKKGGSVNP